MPWRSCLPGRQLQSMQDCNNRHPSYDRWHWHVQCHVYGKSDGDQHCLCIWAGLYVDFLESGRRSPSDTNLPSISLAVARRLSLLPGDLAFDGGLPAAGSGEPAALSHASSCQARSFSSSCTAPVQGQGWRCNFQPGKRSLLAPAR